MNNFEKAIIKYLLSHITVKKIYTEIMRLCYSLFLFYTTLCIYGATAATIRKEPAFATPTYSNNYLPAAIQVTIHILDQIKRADAEEAEQNLLVTEATSPHPPGQEQPLPGSTSISNVSETNVTRVETTTVSDEEKYYDPPERYQEEALIIAKPPEVNCEKINGSELATPEVNQEESEIVYGLPEANYELPESNHELPEESNVNVSQLVTSSDVATPAAVADADAGNVTNGNVGAGSVNKVNSCVELKTSSKLPTATNATQSTVDSVVEEIYSIIKNTSVTDKNGGIQGGELIIELPDCLEGKNSPIDGLSAEESSSGDNKERSDETKDDERFSLLGEKVDQVPRPSLTSFLRGVNGATNPTLVAMAELYEAMSREARKQGLSKFAGYSDEVLKTLQLSAGAGAGLQLKELLEKSVARKEFTRYDAMVRSRQILEMLNDDASRLSTDLRRYLPLRFMI